MCVCVCVCVCVVGGGGGGGGGGVRTHFWGDVQANLGGGIDWGNWGNRQTIKYNLISVQIVENKL